MKPGDKVVVVDPWEEAGDCLYVRTHLLAGRRGEVVKISDPATIGDDPETDPLYVVDLGEGGNYVFWSEELEFQGH